MKSDSSSTKSRLKITTRGRRGPKPGAKKPGTKKPDTPFEPAPLMSYLAAEAQSRNETPVQLAKHLGIGYVYLTQLLSGKKDSSKMGRHILVAAAEYLDVPVAEAYLWAGALLPTDFVHEGTVREMAGKPFEVMSRHPTWGGFLPTRDEWDSFSDRMKLFAVLAFEQATGTTLIDATDKTMVPELAV